MVVVFLLFGVGVGMIGMWLKCCLKVGVWFDWIVGVMFIVIGICVVLKD